MPQGVVVDDAGRFIGGLLALTFNSIALKQLVTAFQGVSAPVARVLQGCCKECCKAVARESQDSGGGGMEEGTRQLSVKPLIPLAYFHPVDGCTRRLSSLETIV